MTPSLAIVIALAVFVAVLVIALLVQIGRLWTETFALRGDVFAARAELAGVRRDIGFTLKAVTGAMRRLAPKACSFDGGDGPLSRRGEPLAAAMFPDLSRSAAEAPLSPGGRDRDGVPTARESAVVRPAPESAALHRHFVGLGAAKTACGIPLREPAIDVTGSTDGIPWTTDRDAARAPCCAPAPAPDEEDTAMWSRRRTPTQIGLAPVNDRPE